MNEFLAIINTIRDYSIEQNLKRATIISPKSYSELKVDDLAFQKRTSFAKHLRPKYQRQIQLKCFQLKKKIGTNSWIVQNLETDELSISTSDLLIRTKLTKEQCLQTIDDITNGTQQGIYNQHVDKETEKLKGNTTN